MKVECYLCGLIKNRKEMVLGTCFPYAPENTLHLFCKIHTKEDIKEYIKTLPTFKNKEDK